MTPIEKVGKCNEELEDIYWSAKSFTCSENDFTWNVTEDGLLWKLTFILPSN